MSGLSNETSDDGSPSPDRMRYIETNFEMSSSSKKTTKSPIKRPRGHADLSSPEEIHSKRKRSASTQSSQSDSGSQTSSSSDSDSESNSSPSHPSKRADIEYDTMGSMISKNIDTASQQDTSYLNNTALEMMAKMGYQKGKGLGKHAQGRVLPVESSKQRGRRGLGLQIPGLGSDDKVEWNPDLEVIEIEESLTWLKSPDNNGLKYNDIKGWMLQGPRKETIDDETNFIDGGILKNILKSKSIFDKLRPEELRRARTKSNPFETIRGAFFLNRAAVKMANMDARTGFMFTNPKKSDGQPAVKSDGLLYFADVCAGPGGFSEYVLWRKRWFAKGFGFTLKGDNDFKLTEFLAGSPETFQTFYGADDDGDIFKPRNIESLKEHVLSQTDYLGVHFMMADGGFSVDGKENIQEILSKQLYLCQCLVALSIVRPDGHFVVKLFDLFTPFSMGLMYLMYKSFKEICIMKPNTSRPANSERYLICKWRCENIEGIEHYLYGVNYTIWEYPINHDRDVNEIVPMHVMKNDEQFLNYFIDSNNRLGEKQIVGLLKIRAYCQHPELVEVRQTEIRRQCLQAWNVDDEIRCRKYSASATEVIDELNELIGRSSEYKIESKLLSSRGNEIRTLDDYKTHVHQCPDETIFMAIAKGKPGDTGGLTFYLGTGGTRIYRYENCKWCLLASQNIALPTGTIVYGEIALEFRGESRAQTNFPALHIIDAIFLGKVPVFNKTLEERIKLCELFTIALSQTNKAVRMKQHMPLKKFHEISALDVRTMKNGQCAMAVRLPNGPDEKEPLFYVPSGFIFLSDITKPWHVCISRKQQRVYYFNSKSNQSTFQRPKNIRIDFFSSFFNRSIWRLESSIESLHPDSAVATDRSLHSFDIMEFLKPNLLE